ncbi:PFGI-1 class ICE element type IV pilus protein PilL2 [Acerihabitans arboris]|uniref:Pilus assembly protein n=1 Tax=Acerihabitans arboris TaxID=2691583 RepID=A0A845SHE2_9GAMM|nr:TcpQ domain-containing protein [Acerihabitans arboris]NDL64290.1 pilus assembly protein [Acerihabitans arboris]
MAQPILHPGTLAWFTLSLLTAGCVDHGTSSADTLSRLPATPRVSDIYQNRSPEVVRYDRYTLVSTHPADAQRDPLNQMVDISMPVQMVRSVGDGFRYLLLESGYSLCPVSSAVFAELLSRPLPAVQRSIGPVRLSEALQILAGPAWRLRVDDVNREVCFVLRDAYRDAVPVRQTVAPVIASNIMPKTAQNQPVRQSGNPFSAPSVKTSAASLTAAQPLVSTPASPLKPENVPVPSPVIIATKNPPLKPVLTTPTASAVVQKSTALTVAKPVALTKAPVTLKPTTAIMPAPSAVPVNTAPVNKPVFTPGAPVAVAPSGQLWRAEVGSTLKETLTRWANEAKCDSGGNWVVIWPVTLDYRIDAPLAFHGNFESVLVQVFGLYRQADKPLFASASRLQCLVSVSDQPGRN